MVRKFVLLAVAMFMALATIPIVAAARPGTPVPAALQTDDSSESSADTRARPERRVVRGGTPSPGRRTRSRAALHQRRVSLWKRRRFYASAVAGTTELLGDPGGRGVSRISASSASFLADRIERRRRIPGAFRRRLGRRGVSPRREEPVSLCRTWFQPATRSDPGFPPIGRSDGRFRRRRTAA